MIIYIFSKDTEDNRKLAIDDFCQRNSLPNQKLERRDNKPTLQNCYISISHTDGVLAVGLSMYNLGIDIERSDRSTKCVADIRQWTRLEAYAKYANLGLKQLIKSHVPDDYMTTMQLEIGYTLSIYSKDMDIFLVYS